MTSNISIDTKCSFLGPQVIETIEKEYNAKYIFESCCKDSQGEWANFPAAIFYTEKAHPDGSNYFAMYRKPFTDSIYIANGISATEPVYVGIVSDNVVVYSRYRHDYRVSGDSSIDGGRDYTKIGGDPEKVNFKVVGDHLEFI